MLHVLHELGFNYSEDVDVRETVIELARLRGLNLRDLELPEVGILALSVGVLDLLVKELNGIERRWIYRARPLYVGHVNDVPVCFIWAGPGAPLATMIMEHLVACGVRYVIGIGLVAAVRSNVDVGSLVLPRLAIRGEGTSYYYLPENVEAVPNEEVTCYLERACIDLGLRYLKGTIFTIDAVLRETRTLIDELARRGVLGIDMETSAIYSVGLYRKVKTGCVLVVSTNPSIRSTGFYSEAMTSPIRDAINVVKRAILYLKKKS
ncbi:MAG: nucleoside phosphorylase [Crenarchaeota archaeon]|nr:nucleoside phosphorylase [Thermoproteota archaeon]